MRRVACSSRAARARLPRAIFSASSIMSRSNAADRVAERLAAGRARALGRLQRRRQVVQVDHLTVADEHRALDDVLQLADVARPVIADERVDRRR